MRLERAPTLVAASADSRTKVTDCSAAQESRERMTAWASARLARAFDRALPLPPEGPMELKPTDAEWSIWWHTDGVEPCDPESCPQCRGER